MQPCSEAGGTSSHYLETTSTDYPFPEFRQDSMRISMKKHTILGRFTKHLIFSSMVVPGAPLGLTLVP
jgi:hypothetical protein